MGRATVCDQCKKVIEPSEISIRIDGYNVNMGKLYSRTPESYGLHHISDFCSFNCLAEWAKEQQLILDDISNLIEKREE